MKQILQLFIGKNDIIRQFEKLLCNKKFDSRFDNKQLNEFKTVFDSIGKINQDIIVIDWHKQKSPIDIKSYDFAGFIDQWILKKLVLKGKSQIWNKSTNMYENRIIYHFVRDQLGGESCYYTFPNGNEFHHQLIVLGE